MSSPLSLASVAAFALLLTACADGASPLTDPSSPRFKRVDAPVAPSHMPTTAPAPGVFMRESFGPDELWRPAGGKGTLKYHSGSINSFWSEWPGTKNSQWIEGDLSQGWKWAGCSINDNQMPSPIDIAPQNGCLHSGEFNGMTVFPSALLPFSAPTAAYEFSIDGYPRPVAGAYIAMGFTSTRATSKALANGGSIWLKMDNSNNNWGPLHYELRLNGMTGPLLASGDEGYPGFNPMKLRIDPVAQTVTLTINNVEIGTYNAAIAPPTYLALEGYGLFDNLVVRQ